MKTQNKTRLLSFPKGWMPYQELYSKAMKKHGIIIEAGGDFNDKILYEDLNEFDGFNFHLPEYFWSSSSLISCLHTLIGLKRFYSLAKKKGKRIVWTVHNHRSLVDHPILTYLGFFTIAQAADLCIVHSRWSENYVKKMFRPKGEIVFMPQGNYDGIYTPIRSSAEIKKKYGLDPELPLCGIIGHINRRRGHELAIQAAKKMNSEIQLLITGNPKVSVNSRNKVYFEKIEASIRDSSNIVYKPKKLTDNEYAEVVRACDLILLPYKEITTSGAMLSSLTLGTAVVMSDLPYFREFKPDNEYAGIIMDKYTVEDLVSCIRKMLVKSKAQRSFYARKEAEKYPWDKVIRSAAQAILKWK